MHKELMSSVPFSKNEIEKLELTGTSLDDAFLCICNEDDLSFSMLYACETMFLMKTVKAHTGPLCTKLSPGVRPKYVCQHTFQKCNLLCSVIQEGSLSDCYHYNGSRATW